MRDRLDDIRAAGAELVLVGNGSKATLKQLTDTVINAAKVAPLPSEAAVVTAPSASASCGCSWMPAAW